MQDCHEHLDKEHNYSERNSALEQLSREKLSGNPLYSRSFFSRLKTGSITINAGDYIRVKLNDLRMPIKKGLGYRLGRVVVFGTDQLNKGNDKHSGRGVVYYLRYPLEIFNPKLVDKAEDFFGKRLGGVELLEACDMTKEKVKGDVELVPDASYIDLDEINTKAIKDEISSESKKRPSDMKIFYSFDDLKGQDNILLGEDNLTIESKVGQTFYKIGIQPLNEFKKPVYFRPFQQGFKTDVRFDMQYEVHFSRRLDVRSGLKKKTQSLGKTKQLFTYDAETNKDIYVSYSERDVRTSSEKRAIYFALYDLKLPHGFHALDVDVYTGEFKILTKTINFHVTETKLPVHNFVVSGFESLESELYHLGNNFPPFSVQFLDEFGKNSKFVGNYQVKIKAPKDLVNNGDRYLEFRDLLDDNKEFNDNAPIWPMDKDDNGKFEFAKVNRIDSFGHWRVKPAENFSMGAKQNFKATFVLEVCMCEFLLFISKIDLFYIISYIFQSC